MNKSKRALIYDNAPVLLLSLSDDNGWEVKLKLTAVITRERPVTPRNGGEVK
jgi:hypothetical protein